LVPPLSSIAVGALLGELAGLGLVVTLGAPGLASAAFGGALGSVGVYVLRGWSVSGTGPRGLLDLGLSPFYVAWKIALRFRRPPRATSEWVRTERETSADAPP
jgi:1,2-diacylglycerol 3-beta-glucosyltransferase